ncbi:MAG TPA: hypothetical protein VG454_02045 [Gemmatimonadales bacterium]|nr:hypothetical protein [Gemmatimonadales bacterium]
MKRIGFAVIAAAGIVACQNDRTLPPGPSAQIQDANHSSGNAFFFWLPPVVNQHAPATQVFSRQLNPVVTITNLCGGAVVRTFSGSDISVSNAAYHVNWATAQDNLNAACTYRVTVRVGTKDLGFADVDVVNSGRELKNVNTNEFIPLLDDRTLPLQFFIGVGSQCLRGGSDCGEGTVHPGQNTVIVSENGQAGVFVPAGAVNGDVTISVESSDERPCIPGLLPPVFPGSPGAVGNSCYDFRTDPPLSEVNERGRFNTPVTVGICPDANAFALDHATLDLLQIFQFDASEESQIRALNNVPAPFLHCDPNFNPSFGARRSLFGDLARAFASIISPRPLYASSSRMMFDLGAGGSTDGFSRFMWALPSAVNINFDIGPDESTPVTAGTAVNSLYSRVGVTFSRSNPEGLCAGTSVYANDHGPSGFNSGQNNITVCPEGVASDFSEDEFGDIIATFTLPQVLVCIGATPLGPRGGELPGTAFIEAFNASGQSVSRFESLPSTPLRTQQNLCVSGTDITSVRFAGTGSGFAIFDNLYYVRVQPPIE